MLHLLELAKEIDPASLQSEFESLHSQLLRGLRSELHDINLGEKESLRDAKEKLEISTNIEYNLN